MIMAWHRSNQTSKRLNYIPGVGPMLATALVASVADPMTFRSGRAQGLRQLEIEVQGRHKQSSENGASQLLSAVRGAPELMAQHC
jgi:transposase